MRSNAANMGGGGGGGRRYSYSSLENGGGGGGAHYSSGITWQVTQSIYTQSICVNTVYLHILL